MSTPTLHHRPAYMEGPEATYAPSAPEETEARLDDLQLEEAKQAATIGEFQNGFKQEAMLVMAEADPETAKLVQSRIDVIAEVAKDNAALALAATEEHVLGYNTIGGGDEGAVMSEDLFGSITTMDEALVARQAAEHEKRHGEQAPLDGGIAFNGKPVTAWMLFEGDAELYGNEQVGWSPTFHRPGQPDDYAEAQEVAHAIRRVIGNELWNRVLTQTGDTQVLQEALDRVGQGRAEPEPAMAR